MRSVGWFVLVGSVSSVFALSACSSDSTEIPQAVDADDDDDIPGDDDDNVPADRKKPMLTITSPRDNVAIDERLIVVTGSVTDDVGVDDLAWSVGGASPAKITADKDGSFRFSFVPTPGDNVVTVTARDAAGNEATSSRSAYFGHRLSGGNSGFTMLADGKLFTWGRNESGQLGNGTLVGNWSEDTNAALPRMYELPAGDRVSVVSRQNFVIALSKDGSIETWGANESGQLGYTTPADCGTGGKTPCGRAPKKVAGVSDAVAIAAGFSHALVLRKDGTVVTFGKNDKGQLGLATGAMTSTPTVVPGLSDVIAIGAGSAHSIALTSKGKVLVWGDNSYGQLATGAADTTAHAKPTEIAEVSDAVSIASSNDTLLVRKADGTVLAWGRNNSGQVGNGTEADVLRPTPVLASAGTPLRNVESIAGDGLVSIAVDHDGKAWAWGAGNLGQLAQGYTAGGERDRDPRAFASPVFVQPGSEASFVVVELEIAAGGSVMALTTEKKVFGWGWSFQGSLGGGTSLLNAWAYTAPFLVYPTLAVPKQE